MLTYVSLRGLGNVWGNIYAISATSTFPGLLSFATRKVHSTLSLHFNEVHNLICSAYFPLSYCRYIFFLGHSVNKWYLCKTSPHDNKLTTRTDEEFLFLVILNSVPGIYLFTYFGIPIYLQIFSNFYDISQMSRVLFNIVCNFLFTKLLMT